ARDRLRVRAGVQGTGGAAPGAQAAGGALGDGHDTRGPNPVPRHPGGRAGPARRRLEDAMNEQLMQRIRRRLETLTDERGYQILDYVEFLESKYAARAAPSNLFAKISEGIEDTMRAARIPIKAISG